jgi:hypothetical protein
MSLAVAFDSRISRFFARMAPVSLSRKITALS